MRYPLHYRRWLKGVLGLFFFLLAISTFSNHKDCDGDENNQDDDRNEDCFEQNFEEAHDDG